jgi:hypothetical protein
MPTKRLIDPLVAKPSARIRLDNHRLLRDGILQPFSPQALALYSSGRASVRV